MAFKIRLNTSEPGAWVSGTAHVALITAGLFAASAPTFPDAQEGIPVEIITDNQFSQITKGETTAKQVQPTPKPRADRVADTVQQREPGEDKRDAPAPPRRPVEMKVAEKEEEVAVQAPAPPPRPEPKVDPQREETQRLAEKAAAEALARQRAESDAKAAAEAKAKAQADAKAAAEKAEKAEADARRVAEAKEKAEEARRVADAKERAEAEERQEAEAKAKAEAEAKRIAEAKADEARKAAEAKARVEAEAKRVAEAKAKAEAEAKRVAEAKAEAEAKARKEAEAARKLDVGDLRQFLNSKERNQSTGATGSEVQKTASLGAATGTAAKLNPSMRDALGGILKDQIERCYTAPIGASSGTVITPRLDIRLNADGSLAAEPRVLRAGSSTLDRSVAEAAARAVRRCAPFNIPAKFSPYYEEWKAWHIEFDIGQT